MRLIDADKLPWVDKVILVDNVDGDVVIKVAPNYTSYVNKETPTVEAIPIEWLKYHVMCRKDLTFDKLELIWSIIKDWEKENETN